MLTYTLAEFLENDVDEGHARIYAVRDGETVLYVGKAASGVRERWLFTLGSHMTVNGFSWQGWSAIGCAIAEHYPVSRDWLIDLYAVEDCRAIVGKRFSGLDFDDPYDRIETAELAMIQELRPLFNVANTGYERETPAKFRRGPAMATLAMDRLMEV